MLVIRNLLATLATAAVAIAPVVIALPAQAADPVVFTVGMEQDVDSLNWLRPTRFSSCSTPRF
ncbi:MAG: hypothetical protein NTV96_03345 [Actinobacteria bacterium]|nr:hypothetical protein [Actinomycetota bacterium]